MSGLLHGVTEARFSCVLTSRVWVDQQERRLGVESPICEWSPRGLPTTHWEVPSLDSAPHSFCATSEKLHLKTQNLPCPRSPARRIFRSTVSLRIYDELDH